MRCLRHWCGGRSHGDRLNRGQRNIRFGLTRQGGGWRIKVPNGNPKGQVREREGGHDGDRKYSGRGSQERDLPSRVMTRRDGFEMVKVRRDRSRRIKGFKDTSYRGRARRRRSGWLR